MGLQLVSEDSTENYFVSTAKVKHSGVHIGDGVFLVANHFPEPGGGGKATLGLGLATEEYVGKTTEYDFTLPDNPTEWALYGANEDGTGLVHAGFDMALHVANDEYVGDGATARMLVYSDPDEMAGNIVNTGYPSSSSYLIDGERRMYYSEGTLAEGSYSHSTPDPESELTGGTISLWGTGTSLSVGMSGGGLFLEADPDGDGTFEYYLIGQTTRFGTATAIADQYHEMAALLDELGHDANNFPRHVLMSGQTLGSTHTTVTGTFFNEDIFGGVNADTLIGGGGDDNLTGGEGGDTFVFSSGNGMDIVYDFTTGEDFLDFSGVQIPIFEATQQGSDVLVTYGVQGDSVLFINTYTAEIEALLPEVNVIDGRGSGSTSLYGTEGDDIILAEGGTGKNGYLVGAGLNPGADTYVNLGGLSYLIFRESEVGLEFDLENRTAYGGDAEGDTWVGEWANIQGTDHNDIFHGSAGNDFVWLHYGNDQFFGNDGDDTIRVSGGVDYIDGGEGYDQVRYSWGLGTGQDIGIFAVDDARKTISMNTYISMEQIAATKFDDTIRIGSGTSFQIIDGERGNDIFNIYANNGTFVGGAGVDTFNIDPDDLNSATTSISIADFTLGEDSLNLLGQSLSLTPDAPLPSGLAYSENADGDLIINFGDNDTLTLAGVDASAYLDTSPPAGNTVDGTVGNDFINGSYIDGQGNSITDTGQTILAGDGDDRIYDGAGDDIINGGNGRDFFYAGVGADQYIGGADRDEIFYTTSSQAITIDMVNSANSTGIATGDTFNGIERLHGSEYDDVIIANGVEVYARGGNDLIQDGVGYERLNGGVGIDTFRFISGDNTMDRISGFELGIDIIDLSLWGVTGIDDPSLSIYERVNGQGTLQNDLIIEYGDEKIRIDGLSTADIASFVSDSFIFA